MIERKIKELSIALEALSRINHYDTMNIFDEIRRHLSELVDELRKPKPKQYIDSDDNIPF